MTCPDSDRVIQEFYSIALQFVGSTPVEGKRIKGPFKGPGREARNEDCGVPTVEQRLLLLKEYRDLEAMRKAGAAPGFIELQFTEWKLRVYPKLAEERRRLIANA